MQEAAELFKILSVDNRIEIVKHLKNGDMCVNALAAALGISQSAVSQHLRVLKAAGLVRNERKGYWIHYSLDRQALEECRSASIGFVPVAVWTESEDFFVLTI